MTNITTKTIAAALAATFTLAAQAHAQEISETAPHAAPVQIDLNEQIFKANTKFEDKLFALVINKAQTTIELDLAKLDAAPVLNLHDDDDAFTTAKIGM